MQQQLALYNQWGEIDPNVRGPIIATNMHEGRRNAIGAHGGSYCIYRALAVANKTLNSVSFEHIIQEIMYTTYSVEVVSSYELVVILTLLFFVSIMLCRNLSLD